MAARYIPAQLLPSKTGTISNMALHNFFYHNCPKNGASTSVFLLLEYSVVKCWVTGVPVKCPVTGPGEWDAQDVVPVIVSNFCCH